MKKLALLLVVAVLLFTSCTPKTVRLDENGKEVEVPVVAYLTIQEQKAQELVDQYIIIVIDSCEYITHHENNAHRGYGYLAHKGNCKFCEERKNPTKPEMDTSILREADSLNVDNKSIAWSLTPEGVWD